MTNGLLTAAALGNTTVRASYLGNNASASVAVLASGGAWQSTQTLYDATAGFAYKYQVWTPAAYTGATAYPLLVWLHGTGENGSWGSNNPGVSTSTDDANRIKYIDTGIQGQGTAFQTLCLALQKPQTTDTNAGWMRQVMVAIAAVQAAYNVDPNRIWIMGDSAGANIIYPVVYRNPGVFAHMVLLSSTVGPVYFSEPDLPSTLSLLAGDANFKTVSAHQYNGTADGTVPIADADSIAAAMQAVNAAWNYTRYPGLDHVTTFTTALADNNTWTEMYSKHR